MTLSTAEIVLLAESLDPVAVLPAGHGLAVSVFTNPEEAVRFVAELRARGAPAVFVLAHRDVNRAAVLMELTTRHPDVPLVVATVEGRTASGMAGRAVMRPAGSDSLLNVVREASRAAVQQSRVRTTLDRLTLRLRSEALASDPRREQRLLLSGLYFANILQQATDGVFVTDRSGTVALWNPAAERLFGVTAPEVVGRPIDHRLGDAGHRLLLLVRELSINHRPAAAELVTTTGEGARHLEVSLSLVCDGDENGVAVSGIVRDTTERHALYKELQTQARALADSNRQKDSFLAVLSHELRTPLNALLGWAHILLATPSDAARVRYGLTVILRNAELEQRLVEDLLDYARIAIGRLVLQTEALDVAEVVRSTVEAVRPAVDAAGIQLSEAYEDRSVAAADRQRLAQVVTNLVTNAIKFTPTGGRVSIDVRRREGGIQITVEDTGRGIAPEFLPFVFAEFAQAAETTRRPERGLGLGLAISRRLVELHGGRIDAASDGVGRGALFTVWLPTELVLGH